MSDRPRKTYDVAEIRAMVNYRIMRSDKIIGGIDLTPQQAYRLAIGDLLREILDRTNNYNGFNFVNEAGETIIDLTDETRRYYY